MKVGCVILAAGMSKRMKSAKPKVIHALLGKPMLSYSIEAVQSVTDIPPVVVVGYAADEVKKSTIQDVTFTIQAEQLGTAHAVMTAEKTLKGKVDIVVITSADMPLVTEKTFEQLKNLQITNTGPLSLVSIQGDISRGFGRIIRDNDGKVLRIVEEKVATQDELLGKEYNAGIYCVASDWLWEALHKIKKSSVGEYYLTDLLEIAVASGKNVEVLTLNDPDEAIGVNNRIHFAEVEKILRERINEEFMLAGVTMVDPERIYIEAGVTIGQDTIIYPDTYIRGNTRIGKNCEIGPGTIIDDSAIGDYCTILKSVLEEALLEDHVEMGPFCRLRSGAHLGSHVHMGNFGEVKKSHLGNGVKMGHFSYIGDAEIGEDVNIGAGTITCNYDGQKKNKTVIGAGTFIGSDTMLVAPLTIGKNAVTGAGAVVTKDVGDGEKVVGVPAHVIKKQNGEVDNNE
ncbi:MAG TPA: UDP-N-acetylglucosamine diphosphorylase/glucosamine-1-phosphate N-acetyltransferase [Anaerolineaceae bacterium]|uniref:Bifunctional protein GlmU n=1 Tax=Anaerolinea thermophila TaxID=167964 RepID=A0A101FXM3_9CHLR|nr:MAG: Bifunctional protein GlmU [Anaerolinea thermophila]HAF62630.1 UDP-N-acetylglucosamine diphosphorylase/glucosamine-1-phosphate N-acetyltransferase [Anaerolineaceae bacterium]